jgi:hypothetical protein
METIENTGLSQQSECLQRLNKYLAEKPECLYGTDGGFNEELLFIVLTTYLPFSISIEKNLNQRRFLDSLMNSEKWQAHILAQDKTANEKDFRVMEDSETETYVLINHQMLISIGYNTFIYYCKDTYPEVLAEVLTLAQKAKMKKKPKEPSFYMISKSSYDESLDLKAFKINSYDVNVALHYNDDFVVVDDKIRDFLSTDNRIGLILLHGKPGTGKTTYIRHLIKSLDKRIIYIPIHLMDILSDPGFLDFISEYENSILILEDCEDMLRPRHETQFSNQSLTNLLNLGDGLLSDALKIKVICTFNADLQNIDNAILRKGRLVARYEFKELELPKTQKLLEHLGKDVKATEPMTLANIYNAEENDFISTKKKKKIGFVTQ